MSKNILIMSNDELVDFLTSGGFDIYVTKQSPVRAWTTKDNLCGWEIPIEQVINLIDLELVTKVKNDPCAIMPHETYTPASLVL